jgi:hypothetical protein
MQLKFLTCKDGQRPSNDLVNHFSDVQIIEISSTKDQHREVARIEANLPQPSLEEFLLYVPECWRLGLVLSRIRFNSGILDENGKTKIGNTNVTLDHAIKMPYENKQRVLFLAAHPDEEFLRGAYLHVLSDDQVHVYSFTRATDQKMQMFFEALRLRRMSGDFGGNGFGTYEVGSMEAGNIASEENMKEAENITMKLLESFNPDTVITHGPVDAHFDHMAVSESVSRIVLSESECNLLYGSVIQSRKRTPSLYSMYDERIHSQIVNAYSRWESKFEPYMRDFSLVQPRDFPEPIRRLNFLGLFSFPLEPARVSSYKIPQLVDPLRIANRLL